jgi:uncharacterized protein
MPLIKIIFIILGTLSLLIGITGIVVPGLPTTPFLLLTAGLYVRSSEKLYKKVTSSRIIGQYITQYQKNKGMSLRSKLYAISLMWLMIAVSCTFFVDQWQIRLIISIAGMIGSFVMVFIIPDMDINQNQK